MHNISQIGTAVRSAVEKSTRTAIHGVCDAANSMSSVGVFGIGLIAVSVLILTSLCVLLFVIHVCHSPPTYRWMTPTKDETPGKRKTSATDSVCDVSEDDVDDDGGNELELVDADAYVDIEQADDGALNGPTTLSDRTPTASRKKRQSALLTTRRHNNADRR